MKNQFIIITLILILTSFATAQNLGDSGTNVAGQIYIDGDLISGAEVEVLCDSYSQTVISVNGSYTVIFEDDCSNVTVTAKKDYYYGISSGTTNSYPFIEFFFLYKDVNMDLTESCGDGICSEDEDCFNCPEDCDNNGHKGYYSITELEMQDCEPNWECSNWAECYEDVKQRNCVDKNYCAIGYNEPMQTTGCQIVMNSQANTGLSTSQGLLITALILLVVLLTILLWKK